MSDSTKTSLGIIALVFMVLLMVIANGCADTKTANQVITNARSEPVKNEVVVSEFKWHTNYEEATATAQLLRRPVLVNFTGSDWCRWCVELDKNVFQTKEFKTWAQENVVLLELDYPREKESLTKELQEQNIKLARKYKIRGFPTIAYLDPFNGKVLHQHHYIHKVEDFTKVGDKVIANIVRESARYK